MITVFDGIILGKLYLMKPLPFWQVQQSKLLRALGACLSPIDPYLISILLHFWLLVYFCRHLLDANASWILWNDLLKSDWPHVYYLLEDSYQSNNNIWPSTIYIIIYDNYYGWRIQPPTKIQFSCQIQCS